MSLQYEINKFKVESKWIYIKVLKTNSQSYNAVKWKQSNKIIPTLLQGDA